MKTIETCFDHKKAKSTNLAILKSVRNSARPQLEEDSVKYFKSQLWIWQNEPPEWRVQFRFRVASLLTLRGTGRGFGLSLEGGHAAAVFFFLFLFRRKSSFSLMWNVPHLGSAYSLRGAAKCAFGRLHCYSYSRERLSSNFINGKVIVC